MVNEFTLFIKESVTAVATLAPMEFLPGNFGAIPYLGFWENRRTLTLPAGGPAFFNGK